MTVLCRGSNSDAMNATELKMDTERKLGRRWPLLGSRRADEIWAAINTKSGTAEAFDSGQISQALS
jgi:hypothetical protein